MLNNGSSYSTSACCSGLIAFRGGMPLSQKKGSCLAVASPVWKMPVDCLMAVCEQVEFLSTRNAPSMDYPAANATVG